MIFQQFRIGVEFRTELGASYFYFYGNYVE